jgi:hypothetical protein
MSKTGELLNIKVFTDGTKQLCLCTAISIFIIFIFVVSPLSNFFRTSLFMKIIALIILGYTIYLNVKQTNLLQSIHFNSVNTPQIKSQLTMNLVCSYVFTIFIGLLFIFVIKSFF